MSNFHTFLVESAMFPTPVPTIRRDRASTTDITLDEVAMLDKEWKANYAIRDDTLLDKLCKALELMLGDTLLSAEGEKQLLDRFLPKIQFSERGLEDFDWAQNPNESHSQHLLSIGALKALGDCLWEYGTQQLRVKREKTADQGSSKINFDLFLDGERAGLVEGKSTSVMYFANLRLAKKGFKMTWVRNQLLAPRMLTKSALYMGLRKMEWLFISSHNHWMVCRLVKGDLHPFLAYSPMVSIENSSIPFRALLGAIMSVAKKFPVEPTLFDPKMALDPINEEEEDEGPLPEDDIDSGSEYIPSQLC